MLGAKSTFGQAADVHAYAKENAEKPALSSDSAAFCAVYAALHTY